MMFKETHFIPPVKMKGLCYCGTCKNDFIMSCLGPIYPTNSLGKDLYPMRYTWMEQEMISIQ